MSRGTSWHAGKAKGRLKGAAGEEEAGAPGDSASGGSASAGVDELPATGGVSLALGAGALLLAGGLVARRIIG